MKHVWLAALVVPFQAACGQLSANAGDGPQLGKPGTYPLAEIQGMVKKPELHVAFVPEAPLGITQAATNSMAEALGQAATQAPHPMQAAASMA